MSNFHQDLNENEARVLAVLVKSSKGNGHDFGYIEDLTDSSGELGISKPGLRSYLGKLSTKGYIRYIGQKEYGCTQFQLSHEYIDYLRAQSEPQNTVPARAELLVDDCYSG